MIGVDVGYGQLDDKVRRNEKVHVIERFNLRYLTPQDLPCMVRGGKGRRGRGGGGGGGGGEEDIGTMLRSKGKCEEGGGEMEAGGGERHGTQIKGEMGGSPIQRTPHPLIAFPFNLTHH